MKDGGEGSVSAVEAWSPDLSWALDQSGEGKPQSLLESRLERSE